MRYQGRQAKDARNRFPLVSQSFKTRYLITVPGCFCHRDLALGRRGLIAGECQGDRIARRAVGDRETCDRMEAIVMIELNRWWCVTSVANTSGPRR